ncbi:PREDICTED: transmembrane protein 109 isoform X1 [Thamnophis sirtalis]|uniref:Transmembrane protein 109 isoform X1 n=2 Tax=Thamnophis sirtalis TaxID=35019 RepID=A0A6I9WYI9_9SAUR|nr:PREDICTED: transmembrane protein 109 isoform X1 [Thamnophis sirtalis]
MYCGGGNGVDYTHTERLGVKTNTEKMVGGRHNLWSFHKMVLGSSLGIIVLLSFVNTCFANAQHHQSSSWEKKRMEPDFLSEVTRTVRKTLENLVGKENFLMVNENMSAALWIVSSGISSALSVVARITGQLLTSFGLAGDGLTQFLKLSPEQVQALLLWSLAALISYWVLSLLFSLLFTIVSRLMWGLKLVLFGGCFAFIVFTVPDHSVQVLLLLALLTLYVLLGWLSGSYRSDARLEAKVHNLERQVEELQRRQKRSPRYLDEE